LAKAVTDIEIRSGALITAGGLLFTALQDGWVVAYNDETLEELWRFNVGTPLKGTPVTYAIGPKQYLAVQTSGRHLHPVNTTTCQHSSYLFVFALITDGDRESVQSQCRIQLNQAPQGRGGKIRETQDASLPQISDPGLHSLGGRIAACASASQPQGTEHEYKMTVNKERPDSNAQNEPQNWLIETATTARNATPSSPRLPTRSTCPRGASSSAVSDAHLNAFTISTTGR